MIIIHCWCKVRKDGGQNLGQRIKERKKKKRLIRKRSIPLLKNSIERNILA